MVKDAPPLAVKPKPQVENHADHVQHHTERVSDEMGSGWREGMQVSLKAGLGRVPTPNVCS